MKIHDFVASIEPDIYEMFKHLHENPELSMQEYNTSAYIEKQLREKTTADSIKKVGETGWVVEIKGTKPGPAHCIALRGDMDALPITESDQFTLRSKNDGVMHACGHDVHTSILLGAVRVLEHYRDQISGSVLFFFQPGEETMSGAKVFLASPDIDFSKIDGVAACHVSPEINAGTIGLKYGAMLASPDALEITVRGKTGHAAHPNTVIDPIVISANIINALQTLVSRENEPSDSAVVSISTIHGGLKNNIIPDEVKMTGTLRVVKPEVREHMLQRIKEICEGIASAFRGSAEVKITLGPPPLINTDEWADRAIRVGNKLLGKENVVMMDIPSMGGEDFAFIMEKCPGVFVRLGARTPGGAYGSMHSSTFYCDRRALSVGILTLAGMALDFFNADYE